MKKKLDLAFKLKNQAALNGNPYAQHQLAVMYQEGMGTKKNLLAAVRMYKKSAEQGIAAAQLGLGSMYENGKGVNRY